MANVYISLPVQMVYAGAFAALQQIPIVAAADICNVQGRWLQKDRMLGRIRMTQSKIALEIG
jgi:hypothetical protein